MVKEFLIQFDDFNSTRWQCSDADLAQLVASVARESVRLRTEGAFPLTTVFPVACSTWRDDKALVALTLKEGVIR